MIVRHLKRLAFAPFLPVYIYGLRRATRKCQSVDEFLHLAFGFRLGSLNIVPNQIPEEIRQLLEILSAQSCQRILEIGTERGGTLYLFSRVISPQGVLVSIDLPGKLFRGKYPRWKAPLYRSFASATQRVYLLRRDSHDPETVEHVKNLLKGELLDFLFIDGDHSYQGVKRDFEMYSPLVRPGGLIAFHDIVPGPEEKVGGVPELWQEIKSHFRHQEIVKDWNQGGYGIGILWVEVKENG